MIYLFRLLENSKIKRYRTYLLLYLVLQLLIDIIPVPVFEQNNSFCLKILPLLALIIRKT
jgi:hypothetical protein